MVSLAKNTFTGIYDDAVEKVDTFSETASDLKNNLTSKVSAFGANTDSLISRSMNSVKDIGSKIKNNKIDLNQAKNRIADALKGSRSAISGLASDFEKLITEDLTGMDSGTNYVRKATEMANSVKMIIDAKEYYFSDGNYQGVNSILNFMNDLGGNSLIKSFDLGAEAALLKGIISEVTDWGIPDLVDSVFGAKYDYSNNRWDYNYNDEFRFSVVKRVSSDINSSTDLATLERLMLHGGEGALVADNPNFPLQLLSGYVFPEGIVPGGPYPVMIPDPDNPGEEIPDPSGAQTCDNYADQLRRLTSILTKLKPDWFNTRRNGELVWNLYFISQASQDATELFLSNDEYRDAILTAPFYRVENGVQLLKTLYPDIVL